MRDFLCHGQLVNDLDFEIRHSENMSGDEWATKLSQFFEGIQHEVEELAFQVYRLHLGEYELEFSSPRVEKFSSNEGPFGHSDFDSEFSSQLDFKTAYQRRDFTINSMGIRFVDSFLQGELIDPYQGLEDLERNQLRITSAQFLIQ